MMELGDRDEVTYPGHLHVIQLVLVYWHMQWEYSRKRSYSAERRDGDIG